MGRGVSSGGGQSSLGYLFGRGGESPSPEPNSSTQPVIQHHHEATAPTPKPTASVPKLDAVNQIPAGINSNHSSNYYRADGQNTGNFITDRPSTKVHADPGGGSSLGYLFGGGSN